MCVSAGRRGRGRGRVCHACVCASAHGRVGSGVAGRWVVHGAVDGTCMHVRTLPAASSQMSSTSARWPLCWSQTPGSVVMYSSSPNLVHANLPSNAVVVGDVVGDVVCVVVALVVCVDVRVVVPVVV